LSQAKERSTIHRLGRTSHSGLMRAEISTPRPSSRETSCVLAGAYILLYVVVWGIVIVKKKANGGLKG